MQLTALRTALRPLLHGKRASWILPALAAAGAAAAFTAFKVRQAERRHPPAGRFIEVDGVRLHFTDRGLGRPVVFLHGLGSTTEDFRLSGLVDRCAESHRVIAFDRPGYGYSERPRGRAWTPAAQARLLHRALRQLGVDKAVVLGHSWGTLVAASMALQFPASVQSLVLVSGYYYPTARLDALLLGGPAVPVLGDLASVTVSPLLGRLLWPLWRKVLFSPAPASPAFRQFPAWLSLRPRALRAGAAESLMIVPAAFGLRGEYAKIAAPTFIVAGESDRYVSTPHQSARLHRAVPGSRLRVLPGAGHMVHHVAPDEVMQAISAAMEASVAAHAAA